MLKRWRRLPRSLEQLDSFLGTNRPKVVSAQINDDDNEDELDVDFNQSFILSGKIKAGLHNWNFISSSLVCNCNFQKIFNEESKAIVTDESPKIQIDKTHFLE